MYRNLPNYIHPQVSARNIDTCRRNINIRSQNVKICPQNVDIWPQNINVRPQNIDIWPHNINVWSQTITIWPQNIDIKGQGQEPNFSTHISFGAIHHQTAFATLLENPFSSRCKMSTPPKRVPKKRKSKVSFRNSKNSFHSAQQQKSQIRIYSGSFSLTPTDNSTGARSTADRRPSAPTRPRCPPTTSQKTPDRHQASTLKSHKSFESDAIRSETPERTYVYQHHSAVPTDKKGTPNKKGPKSTKKTLKGVTPRDHRVTTQKAPQNRDKASTTLTHPTTTHTRPLKGGRPHILHLNPSSFRHRSKVCGRGGGGEGKVEPYTTSFQSPLNNCEVSALGKPSSNSCCRHLGIARKRGGGLTKTPPGNLFSSHTTSHLISQPDKTQGHFRPLKACRNNAPQRKEPQPEN